VTVYIFYIKFSIAQILFNYYHQAIFRVFFIIAAI
jgi:hypothetical protein